MKTCRGKVEQQGERDCKLLSQREWDGMGWDGEGEQGGSGEERERTCGRVPSCEQEKAKRRVLGGCEALQRAAGEPTVMLGGLRRDGGIGPLRQGRVTQHLASP